jgi:DNA-binding CsgD family transcriptional regulator
MAEPAAPLTARENEVAELVADGMTNAEIARMLNLSRRTIEVHLDHVRQKLGTRSRVGVATWVVVRSIRPPTSPS